MARWHQIIWDDKKSFDDFEITINSKEVGNPNKKKRRVRIPNSNLYYDYASIMGEEYEERKIKYVFNLGDFKTNKKEIMNNKKISVLNWLMPGTQRKLVDDSINGYYFLAEVQDAPVFSEKKGIGTLEVTFTAYPFKISTKHSGDDIWDDFNFEDDIAQKSKFEIDGFQDITIINNSVSKISPIVEVKGNIEIFGEGFNIRLSEGKYTNTQLILNKGKNEFKASGHGILDIYFYREVI